MPEFNPKHKKDIDYSGNTSLKAWWKMVADNFESLIGGIKGWTKDHIEANPIDHPDGSVTTAKFATDATAPNSAKLGGELPSYYALNEDVENLTEDLAIETSDRSQQITNHQTAEPIDHPDSSVTTAKIKNNAVNYSKLFISPENINQATPIRNDLVGGGIYIDLNYDADTLEVTGMENSQLKVKNSPLLEGKSASEFVDYKFPNPFKGEIMSNDTPITFGEMRNIKDGFYYIASSYLFDIAYFGDGIYHVYGINFKSGATATTFTAPNFATYKWRFIGTDCVNQIFTPVANKTYSLNGAWDNNEFVWRVSV